MRFVVLDFETYFADDYTLSKMTTEAYIRDPRFQAHGAAIKWSKDHAAKWYDEPALRYVLSQEDWSDVFLIHHHASFDGLVLSHHYDISPKMYGCTLSMARLLLGNHISVSLDSVRKEFGFPAKKTPYNLFKGKKWSDLDQATRNLVAEGACDEVESIWKLFGILAKDFPKEEYLVVDQTIRMFTQPVLRADTALLAKIWEKEEHDKQVRLAALGVGSSDLASSDRFAALLRDAGVEPETKEGPPRKSGERGTIYAFAKTDPFMEELLTHEDPYIRTLAEARLGEKSNILQTRAETLGWMASRGPLCVYLRMYGAHTTRWSGGDSSNFQNFKKPDPEYPEQAGYSLRDAILPPEGYILAKPDLSQVECRLLNFVAGQDDVIERFRNGQDPYVNVASAFYGYAINKKDHPKERQVGKVLELQAGYGSGAAKIAATLRTKAGIILSEQEALKARDAYRDTHPEVCDFWKQGGRLLARLAGGPPCDWGPTHIRDGKIYLPNGCPLNYQTLEFYRDEEACEEYWRLKTRRGWTKMYGAKLVENCLGRDTQVLTHKGWKYIAQVEFDDLIYDGVEFVSHKGVKHTPGKFVDYVNGVKMTAEHEVLTTDGWIRAALAGGSYREDVRLPDSYSGHRDEWPQTHLAVEMYVWDRSREVNWSDETREIVRLQKLRKYARTQDTRNVEAPGVRGMEVNAGSVLESKTPRMEKLWRAWDYCVRQLDKSLRILLEGYGVDVSARPDNRTAKQQQGIFEDELLLGDVPPTGSEQERESIVRDTLGPNDGLASGRTFGYWGEYAMVPNPESVADRKMVCKARFYEPVYDIVECGPRRRFVVMGSDGPFIVHNCIQALARVVISQAFIRLVGLGYRIVGTEHDSLWILIPKDGKEQWHIDRCLVEMSRAPSWLPGIPLSAECN